MIPHRSSLTAGCVVGILSAGPLSLLLGCNEAPVHDLGYTDAPLSTASAEPAVPLPPVAQSVSDFEGVWFGIADDPLALQGDADRAPPPFHFPSGSTRIRLEMRRLSADQVPATLTFGEAPPPPPATDGSVGYPIEPDLSFKAPIADRSLRPAVEGVVYAADLVDPWRDVAAAGIDAVGYAMSDAAFDGKLDLSFNPNQVFESWCALQTAASCPVDQGYGIDDDGHCFAGPDWTPIDCLKLTECASNACSCTDGGGCIVASDLSANLTIRFSSSGIVGLFDTAVFLNDRGFQQPLGAVHFQRAPQ